MKLIPRISKKNGKNWHGTIAEYPEIEYAAETVEIVQEKLPDMLEQTLIAKEKAWDQQSKRIWKPGGLTILLKRLLKIISQVNVLR